MFDLHEAFEALATMADAHREWHLNAGVPMGTPGCPQDACHPPYDEYDGDDEYDPLTPEELAQFDAWAAEQERLREEAAMFAATQADDGIPF